jgi:hypothetical protein
MAVIRMEAGELTNGVARGGITKIEDRKTSDFDIRYSIFDIFFFL